MDNANEIATPTRKRSRSRSSSSSSSSAPAGDSGSDSSRPPSKRARSSRRRSLSTESELDRRFDQLSQQLVSHVNNILHANMTSSAYAPRLVANANPAMIPGTCFTSAAAPASSLEDSFLRPPPGATVKLENIANLEVSIKEPMISKANPDRVAKITSMQRFDSLDWNAVRYTDVQKKYVASPAFVELKVNEELRRLEDPLAPLRWFQMERSFAALSNAFLVQNESVNSALQLLIDWSAKSEVPITSTTLYDKLKELFGNDSAYKTVSHDILQIMCGKRAEVLELRRALLKNIKGKYLREDIDKIPLSNEYMFNPQSLSTYIQRIGGIDKLDKQVFSARPTRPKSPEPSTSSYQDKSFRGRPIRPRHNEKKEFSNRRPVEDFASKKKGGRKDKARKSGYKRK